jgi:hypothetical protein
MLALPVSGSVMRRWRLLSRLQFCQAAEKYLGGSGLERNMSSLTRKARDGVASTKPSSSVAIGFVEAARSWGGQSVSFCVATMADGAHSSPPCIYFVQRKFHFGIEEFSTANNRTVPGARFRHASSRLLLIVGRVFKQREPGLGNSKIDLLCFLSVGLLQFL